MNQRLKRYHPLLIIWKIFGIIKDLFIIGLILFVIQRNSESMWIQYGRIGFFLLVGGGILLEVLKWFKERYEWDEQAFHLYDGIVIRSKRTVPFRKIENINEHATFFHKMFGVTSVKFETGMQGSEAAVEFPVISKQELKELKKIVNSGKQESNEEEEKEEQVEIVEESTVHFKAKSKDLVKASFTSFSFFFIIPFGLTIYSQLEELLPVSDKVLGIWGQLSDSPVKLFITVLVFVCVAILYGLVRTFFKYGNYEILSDEEFIYIKKGILDESRYSIAKSNIQAIEVKQPWIKKMFNYVEIHIISVGELEIEDQTTLTTIYPFLPRQKAYALIEELLPKYQVKEQLERLPRKALWMKLFRPSWFWVIATGLLYYFKPSIFKFEIHWAILSTVLLGLVIAYRMLSFYYTRYLISDHFVYFQSGVFTTNLFLSKREKVIEVNVERGPLQKRLGLASIKTTNRGKPIHEVRIQDVPYEVATNFLQWYLNRVKDVKVLTEETDSSPFHNEVKGLTS